MAKYYDQSCPDCNSCGWFGRGQYPNGKPYIRCEWFGYILHDMVEEGCVAKMSPAKVAEFKSRFDNRLKNNKKRV